MIQRNNLFDFGRVTSNTVLDAELEGGLVDATAVAGSQEAHKHAWNLDFHQFDSASVALEEGSHFSKRLFDAVLERHTLRLVVLQPAMVVMRTASVGGRFETRFAKA